MKGYIVFTHELRVAHIVCTFVGPPPAFPILAFARIYPFLRAGDVFDRRVEPDIEDFTFHSRPGLIAACNGHAPVKITGNATVL